MNHRNLINLNGNILVSVDTETTGLMPGFHDLNEIAIIALDSEFNPVQSILPFHMMLQPKRPQNADEAALKKQGRTLAQIMLEGMDPWRAADLFEGWVERLRLVPGKRLSPLAHNWPFDRGFILDWLGKATFESFIDGRYRDTQTAALFLNDLADVHQTQCPFPKVKLGDCAFRLGVPLENAHTAIEDAAATAQVYKRMLYGVK